MNLAELQAAPDGTAPRLTETEVTELLPQLPGWSCAGDRLTRELKLKNFRAALNLVNAIGELAEAQNHHPDLLIHGWNHVRIELYTHTAGGLSLNDFIMAAKFDGLLPN